MNYTTAAMSDHSHHHMHHEMTNSSPESSTATPLVSTVASVLQTVFTTVSDHHNHKMAGDSAVHYPTQESTTIDHSQHVSSQTGDSDHGMLMYFHSGVDAIVLFKDWNITTTQGMVGSVIAVFFMALLYEGIKFFREYMFKRHFTSLEYSSVSVLGDDGKTVTEVHKVVRNRMFSWPHATQTFMHVIQMVLSYFLMLIFMTYNIWLCLGVVLGAGTGYFLFGWKKATVIDITEHCH